jgi:hypothetical protein
MAIQPIALQATINQSTQISGVQLQADLASQTFQTTLAAEFASQVVARSETVHETRKLAGNRVNEDDRMTPGLWESVRKSRKAKRLFDSVAPGGGSVINVLV